MPRPPLETVPGGLESVSLDRILQGFEEFLARATLAEVSRIAETAFELSVTSGDGYTVAIAKETAKKALARLNPYARRVILTSRRVF